MELTAEELQAIEVALDGFYPVSHSALVLKFRQMNYDIQKADLGEGPRPVVKREKRAALIEDEDRPSLLRPLDGRLTDE